MFRFHVPVLIGMVAASGALRCQDDAPLKARELFYKPLNATPASTPAAPEVKPAAPEVKPAAAVRAKKATVKKLPAPVPAQSAPEPTSGLLTEVAYTPQPLGLRYSIVKRSGERYDEVEPDSEFRSGDRIRINVESNDTAYLYIVTRGSSGMWQVLFPNAAISGGSNKIARGRMYQIPPPDSPSFYFNEQPGTEKVSLILARTPELDLEKLIYATGENKTMMAKNTAIGSDVMGHVQQQMLSRDLVFEKGDAGGASARPEKAMYVATPDTSAGARVFVNLDLIHK